jgi:hypothetical protein
MKNDNIFLRYFLFFKTITLVLLLVSCVRNNKLKESSNSYFGSGRNLAKVQKTRSNLLDTMNNIKVITLQASTIFLFDTIESKTLLFYFNPNKSCSSCIEETIEFLNTFLAKNYPNYVENIVMVTSYDNIKYLKLLKNKYSIQFTCLNTQDFLFENLIKQYEYHQFLVFLNDNRIKAFFPIYPSITFSSNLVLDSIVDFFKND